MKLIEVNKAIYRKHLNIVIVAFISSLLILSLVFGTGLIAVLSDVAVPTEEVNNFNYNLLGVILSLLFCGMALHQLKNTPFFKEIYYVWQLKQSQNLIYRKVKKVKAAAKQADVNALIIMNFYYTSLKQVYLLDDNTLTLSKLERDLNELHQLIADHNLSISSEQFTKTLLKAF